MRLVANTLLALLIAIGLMLPSTFGRAHEVPCSGGDDCDQGLVDAPHHELDHCHGCPPPPPEDCPCDHSPDHENSTDSDGHENDAPLAPDHDGRECPSHGHHHHHHQCVCSSSGAWLISDENIFALHPPIAAPVLTAGEHPSLPEPPVNLLDRPPRS